VAVARGRPQIVPSGVLLSFLLGLESLLDLRHLELDQGVADVATDVDVRQVLTRFVNAIDRDQPAGRFWDHDQTGDADDWEEDLEERGNSPCPAARVVASSESGPGSDHGSEVPAAVVLDWRGQQETRASSQNVVSQHTMAEQMLR
jgi:hypothetical protein